ncbi:MAG: glucans biosynthesis glucosyltransferase MdoH [Hyphomicrobiaceae bacterium]|nr:MAG: glucans biosynthesis glucosyltransferase MdoH [Hyphomicrobiaceae bacterium]
MDSRLEHRSRRSAPGRSQGKRDRLTRPNTPPVGREAYRPRPLAMPAQDLRSSSVVSRALLPDPAANWRRLALLIGTLAVTSLFAWKLYTVLAFGRVTPLEIAFLVLSTLAFAWVALGTVSALFGFIALMRGEPISAIRLPDRRLVLQERTALLCPIYHEDPERVAATLTAMARDIDALGAARAFSIFVLSDSRSEEAEAAERRAIARVGAELRGRVEVFYRRRQLNEGKKAGNVAEWIRHHGGGFAHFIVLDADSLMSARLVGQLAAAMEQHARAGLIQTVPRLIASETLMARLQQFACGLYGPVIAAGMAWWQRSEGNYWGHNAIVRTAAFAEAAGLPVLPGRAPFGGHILSHDFVEAALLLRAGWEVHMAPEAEGSYEAAPPTLFEVAVRDRRWAQGNLQHIGLLRTAGLRAISRLHLAMGAFSYLSSLLWAAMLVVGVILALQAKHYLPSYFADRVTLFPIWPEMDSAAALTLFFWTMAIVLLPKVLGLTYVLADGNRRRIAGGAPSLLGGAAIEIVLSMLLAPIQMVLQSRAVLEILMGQDSGWGAQKRDGKGLSFADAVRFHRSHIAIGAVTGLLCCWVSLPVLAWMSPVILGLLLSAPLSWWTSRPAAPSVARWLATKEDVTPPLILLRAKEARRISPSPPVFAPPRRPRTSEGLQPAA